MKKLVFLFLLCGLGVFAQTKQDREISSFTGIQVSQGVIVDFTQSDNTSLQLSVEHAEDLEKIRTEVAKDGTLKIYVQSDNVIVRNKEKKGKRKTINTSSATIGRVNVKVTGPVLKDILATSASQINIEADLKTQSLDINSTSAAKVQAKQVYCDNLILDATSASKIEGVFQVSDASKLSATSASKIEVIIRTNSMDISATSASSVILSGNAKQTLASTSSSASIKAVDFETADLQAKASSSSSMRFSVSDKLSGTASSAGSIKYKGNPTISSKKVSSAGSISQI